MTRAQLVRRVLKPAAFVAAAAPLGLLVADLFGRLTIVADPIRESQLRTGLAALVLLFCSLAVTPLRRWTGIVELATLRRMLGLWAFAYAALHAGLYFVFDQELDPTLIAADVLKHPWVTVGFAAFVLLLPLAATSTEAMIRRLGGARWRALHRLAYVVAILGVLHFLWLVKKDVREPVAYAFVLAVLLGSRLVPRRRPVAAAPLAGGRNAA